MRPQLLLAPAVVLSLALVVSAQGGGILPGVISPAQETGETTAAATSAASSTASTAAAATSSSATSAVVTSVSRPPLVELGSFVFGRGARRRSTSPKEQTSWIHLWPRTSEAASPASQGVLQRPAGGLAGGGEPSGGVVHKGTAGSAEVELSFLRLRRRPVPESILSWPSSCTVASLLW